MNARRTFSVARKEFLHVLRDPRSLALAVAIPALLLFLFGYALSLDVDRIPFVVCDQSRTPASRELVAAFTGSRFFACAGHSESFEPIARALDAGEALMGIVIPPGYDAACARRGATVQAVFDGSDPSTAEIALGYARAVARSHSVQIRLRRLDRAGRGEALGGIDLRPRVWFNEEVESRNFIIPGLISLIMMVIAALLTSLTVAREWERGTMEQLISTPVTGPELVVGKLAPYFAVGIVDVLVAMGIGELLFDVPLRGSPLTVVLVSCVFLIGALSMGVVVSIGTRNQLLANQLAMVLTFLPAFLLSGFVFPISSMPAAVRAVTYLVPARYFITALRAVYLKGLGVSEIAGEIGLLAAFSVAMIAIAVGAFRKRIE